VAKSLTVGLVMLAVELAAIAAIRRFGLAAQLRELSEARRQEVKVMLIEEGTPGA
jgi:hypothetical protein